MTNSTLAQSSAPVNAGILNGRVADFFRWLIELLLSEFFIGKAFVRPIGSWSGWA
jgi:hypothetical protein